MKLPLNMLLDTSGGHKSLIYKTFRVRCLVAMDFGDEGDL